ncbi:hypothetical protein [Chamaesiphon sp. GL140_3_metabinner_50]|uniref:hypothetical protein n=1 Tax=Chamaesiphon sp. GL140_3_metabinner_50 TaxID=2970812 RepID=UPI0025DC0EB8|nr:hypothetical protein [Chamaesiphon sp. GL140_3_metabinner_50]
MLLARILDRIGDWNPHLMRELNCRLNGMNLTIATVISIFIQVAALFIPDLFLSYGRNYSCFTPEWWVPVCELLGRELWLTMAIGGTYFIARDFAREMRNGTLNLVNLSPAKPLEILLGKLLGVPILIYWVVFLALPLHSISIFKIASVAPNAWLWDLVAFALVGLLYLCSTLAIIVFRIQPILLCTILPAIGSAGLVIIGSRLNHYSYLGVYFADEWLLLFSASLAFFVGSFPLLKLIQSWYPRINSLHARDRSLSVAVLLSQYPVLLFIYLLLVCGMPVATLLATIVIAIVITKTKALE